MYDQKYIETEPGGLMEALKRLIRFRRGDGLFHARLLPSIAERASIDLTAARSDFLGATNVAAEMFAGWAAKSMATAARRLRLS